ncbi:MAG TPA: carbamate kinase [Acidimicrobiia bacterium]|nr:carbamate kinase [Acidimicrobiia bacterium]
MRVVVALGGNALLPRGKGLDFTVQQSAAREAAASLAPLASRHRMVLTHGNGPQVGLLALQSESYGDVASYPLDVLVAESEGMIGYILETELERMVDVPILTVLTRTVVRADDPAFEDPTKPIGPIYPVVSDAQRLATERGWQFRMDGPGMRRVVASPEPVRIVQAPLIRRLSDDGILVICGGGGGIPVVDANGATAGIEAVVDKDLASSLLASSLQADVFMALTDVDGVYEGWGEPDRALVRRAGVEWFRSRSFESGSMGPKVEAACRFVERLGGRAFIGRLDQASQILGGEAGTEVVAGRSEPVFG